MKKQNGPSFFFYPIEIYHEILNQTAITVYDDENRWKTIAQINRHMHERGYKVRIKNVWSDLRTLLELGFIERKEEKSHIFYRGNKTGEFEW